MKPKFNKEAGRWGIVDKLSGAWLADMDTEKPLKFKSKQEAQARIDSYDTKL